MTSPGQFMPCQVPHDYIVKLKVVAAENPVTDASWAAFVAVAESHGLSYGDYRDDFDKLKSYYATEETGFPNQRAQLEYMLRHAMGHLLGVYDPGGALENAHKHHGGDPYKTAAPLRYRP